MEQSSGVRERRRMKSKEAAGIRINLGLKEEVRFSQMKQRETTSQEEEITSRDPGA